MVSVNDYRSSMHMWFSDAHRKNVDIFGIDFLWADMPEYRQGSFEELFIDLPRELGYEIDANSINFRNDLDGVNLMYRRTVKFTEMELLQKACYETRK